MAGLGELGEPALVDPAVELVVMLGSSLAVAFGVLLSAVMAVSIGSADDDPL